VQRRIDDCVVFVNIVFILFLVCLTQIAHQSTHHWLVKTKSGPPARKAVFKQFIPIRTQKYQLMGDVDFLQQYLLIHEFHIFKISSY
jgi:hypothetical protein